jgi:uncharacterized membrane protein
MDEYDKENANPWKLGFIYYNPDDTRVIVRKRFALGWTFNFARKRAYLYLAATIIIALLLLHYKKTTTR